MEKLGNLLYNNSCRSLIFPDSSFPKLPPAKSIWKKIIDVRTSKFANRVFAVKRSVALIAESNKIRNTIISLVTVNMVSSKFLVNSSPFMRSATLASIKISFKCNFFVQIEGSRIIFLRFLTGSTHKPMSGGSSIFFFALTAFNKILSHRDNSNFNLLQSLCQGEC